MEFILTFLFISALVVLVLGRLLPYILTWIMKRHAKRFFNAAPEDFVHEQEVKDRKKEEGKVTVSGQSGSSKVIHDNEGDYVDFEEVKD